MAHLARYEPSESMELVQRRGRTPADVSRISATTVADAVLTEVKDLMAKMLAGQFTRFDVFSGEIKDNKGTVIIPAGEKMVQADLDQFPPGAPGLECKYCMYWWADGITAELPKL